MNFQIFKLVLEKAEEPKIKLPTAAGSSKKEESSRKTSISALLTMPKPLTVWITTNCGKMGSIKDRNGRDITEAEDIQKRCQEYTEELYKKELHDLDNHDGVITHLEPNILCKAMWASL